MVERRDRDGADTPDEGAGPEGASGSEASDAEEPAFGSSDWFYHQLSGGRRRAREAEPTAESTVFDEDADVDDSDVDDAAGGNAGESVPPPTRAFDAPTSATTPISAFDAPTRAFEPPVPTPAVPSFDPQFPEEPTPAADVPPTTWSILDVPVTPAAPSEPVTPAEPKPQTGPILEPGAPFVWGLKPGVGSDPLVEPPAAGPEPGTAAPVPPGEPEPATHNLSDLPEPISPAAALPEPYVPASEPTPQVPDEFAPPTRAFQPPTFDLPAAPIAPPAFGQPASPVLPPAAAAAEPVVPPAPAEPVLPPARAAAEPVETPAAAEPVTPPAPAEPALPVPPSFYQPVAPVAPPAAAEPVVPPAPAAPILPGALVPPPFAAQPEPAPESEAAAEREGAVGTPDDEAADDEADGEGHGLAALLGMFEESEVEAGESLSFEDADAEAAAPAAPVEPDASAAPATPPAAPEPAEAIPPMAPGFFEPAPLVPPTFAVPVVPVVPPAPPAVPIEGPRFPSVPGLVPPPVGAAGSEHPFTAPDATAPDATAPDTTAPVAAASATPAAFDEEGDDEGIDDIAAPPYDEAAARAAAADTATVLMDAAAIEAVRADSPEPAEAATLLMGGIPSPATQALDAESLAEASAPTSGLAPVTAPTSAMAPASAAAAAAAAGPDEVLPTSRRRGRTPPGSTPPGSTPPGDGTPGSRNNNRLLFWVAGGIVALLILIGLFVFGTRLPSMFTAGTPAPSATSTSKATATPTPTPTPKPTVIAKPGAPQPVGVSKWYTLAGGECIQPYTTPWAETFTIVDCGTPHAAQMVYSNLFSSDPAAPYPGAPALANQINLLCTKPGVINLQAASAFPDLQLQGTYPATPQQWTDGLRSYYCFASRSSGQPITGSVAGPGPQG